MISNYPNPLDLPIGTVIAGDVAETAIADGYAVPLSPKVKAAKKKARKQAKKSRRANRP